GDVILPGVGEEGVGAALVEPVDLLLAQHEDTAQHELGDALGVLLGVRERERAAPGAAEHLPAIDLEVLAEALHVGDEVPGGVVVEAGVGPALAAAALVEQDDAVSLGVEEAALLGLGATAGASVDKDGRLAVGVARLLEVDLVDASDAEG